MIGFNYILFFIYNVKPHDLGVLVNLVLGFLMWSSITINKTFYKICKT